MSNIKNLSSKPLVSVSVNGLLSVEHTRYHVTNVLTLNDDKQRGVITVFNSHQHTLAIDVFAFLYFLSPNANLCPI